MSCPSTTVLPESGRINPIANFNIRLFPEPATPNKASVSPRAKWQETPRSTSLSPKPNFTSSNTITRAASSCTVAAAESSGKVGADIGLMIGKNSHQQSGYEKIED